MVFEQPELARRWVVQYLGPIQALGKRASILLGTLHAYLRHGQRPTNTARQCNCDPDTVRNRLREIEATLGYRIEERSIELGVALMLWDASRRPQAYGKMPNIRSNAEITLR